MVNWKRRARLDMSNPYCDRHEEIDFSGDPIGGHTRGYRGRFPRTPPRYVSTKNKNNYFRHRIVIVVVITVAVVVVVVVVVVVAWERDQILGPGCAWRRSTQNSTPPRAPVREHACCERISWRPPDAGPPPAPISR